MGILAKGDVVVAPLDFSDFSNYKRRPALVIATPDGLDPILCMITSRKRGDVYDAVVTKADFESGGLRDDSVVRACHIFSIDESIIECQVGKLKDEKVKEVITKIVQMLSS